VPRLLYRLAAISISTRKAASRCCTSCARRWACRFKIRTSPNYRARSKSTVPTLEDTSRRRTGRLIAEIADLQKSKPASVRSWFSLAKSRAAPGLCVARERSSAADTPTRRFRVNHPCRRIERVGAPARVLRRAPCQSQCRVQGRRRREREPSRVVLLAAPARRNRPASSD